MTVFKEQVNCVFTNDFYGESTYFIQRKFRILWSKCLNLAFAVQSVSTDGRLYGFEIDFDQIDERIVKNDEFYKQVNELELDYSNFIDREVILSFRKKEKVVLKLKKPCVLPIFYSSPDYWNSIND